MSGRKLNAKAMDEMRRRNALDSALAMRSGAVSSDVKRLLDDAKAIEKYLKGK